MERCRTRRKLEQDFRNQGCIFLYCRAKKKPKRDTVIPGKGGKGNYTPEGIRKMPTISREMAKDGEVKKYMGGGSVHKKKNKMLTTKGWGASRKT